MSRLSSRPITIPKEVNFSQAGQLVQVKGPKGELSHQLHNLVVAQLAEQDGMSELTCHPVDQSSAANAQTGTARALLNNMVIGVSQGFQKQLDLVGIGYRAQLKGSQITLNLGFSHPVEYTLPKGVEAESPSNTQVVIKGADKQLVGQVAAEIRSFRPPEPYKGKGVRYSDEVVIRKEAKKK